MKDVWVEMRPEDYIIQLKSKDVAGGLCALAIRKRKFGTALERAPYPAQKDGASRHIERRAFHRRVKR